jgi:hypothetical protein
MVSLRLRLMIMVAVMVLGARHKPLAEPQSLFLSARESKELFNECVLAERKWELLATPNSAAGISSRDTHLQPKS